MEPQFCFENQLIPYAHALEVMEQRALNIAAQKAEERIWFLEHPPLYTAGTSAEPQHLLHEKFDVHHVGRGGSYTYHGPGQRTVYVMLHLKRFDKDLRAYVRFLEKVLMDTLLHFGIESFTHEERVGVWVHHQGFEKKIAAIGVRVKKWVSFHGIALNVSPDLDHFKGIVPCGLQNYGVTSLHDLDVKVSMDDVDAALKQCFLKNLGL